MGLRAWLTSLMCLFRSFKRIWSFRVGILQMRQNYPAPCAHFASFLLPRRCWLLVFIGIPDSCCRSADEDEEQRAAAEAPTNERARRWWFDWKKCFTFYENFGETKGKRQLLRKKAIATLFSDRSDHLITTENRILRFLGRLCEYLAELSCPFPRTVFLTFHQPPLSN